MTPQEFADIFDGKAPKYILPTLHSRATFPITFIARYNQSVHHLLQLAAEVQKAMTAHTDLERQQQDHLNGAKK